VTSGQAGAQSMAELMSSSSSKFTTLKKGDIIEGTVKKLTPKEILLDIGAKSDALVIEYDKANLANLLAMLKEGDRVKASVISAESEEGFPVVSLRRMLEEKVYGKLSSQQKSQEKVRITIMDGNSRGGYFAETKDGVKGFLPLSQVMADTDVVGKTIDAIIIESDRAKKRVIFSQKATVYIIDPKEIEKVVKKGDTVKGAVESVTGHGIYVTLTPSDSIKIEGFVHVSEMSYQRVEDVSALFSKGDEITAQVLEMDTENRRVNLSIKRLEKDTFEDVKTKYPAESSVTGTVSDVKSRGVTIKLDDSLSGFIPAAKIPSETTYTVGDSVNVQVTGHDEKRRLVLLAPVMTTKFVGYR
jgi:small subunit ribosomal protein S1